MKRLPFLREVGTGVCAFDAEWIADACKNPHVSHLQGLLILSLSLT